jgi:hypothetical protein
LSVNAAYLPDELDILVITSGRGVGPSKWLKGSKIMWDTVTELAGHHLSHEMPCTACGHAPHTFLPCSDTCDCTPPSIPGSASGRTVELVLR